ncbi:MAG: hypothetical protein IT167_16110 [Bryobacterales bacterium]|nr:hypothetical protein [Bryobacterales bacterium]
MRYLKLFAAAFLLSAAGFAQEADYFPLQVGNQWVYKGTGSGSNPFTVEVTGTETIGGNEYFSVTGFPQPLLLRKNQAGTLVIYDREEKREKTWVAFSAAAGEAFRTEVDPCNATAVIRTRQGELKSPFGEFSNALQVGYQPSCADAGLTSESFLPYVGLVRRTMTTIAGERKWDLIYTRLGGFSVFTEREVSFQTALDASQYKAGDAMTVRISLRGTLEPPLQLTFPTGQDFDLILRNEKGDEVYRWALGKLFTNLFRQFPLTGEKNWVLTVPVPEVPAGNYTATANLAVLGPRYEATIPFVIAAK